MRSEASWAAPLARQRRPRVVARGTRRGATMSRLARLDEAGHTRVLGVEQRQRGPQRRQRPERRRGQHRCQAPGPEVEGAHVPLRVPVHAAEGGAAAAREPRQAHALPAVSKKLSTSTVAGEDTGCPRSMEKCN